MKPRIYTDERGRWNLDICTDSWICYGGWPNAVSFLRSLYNQGYVARIQARYAALAGTDISPKVEG